MARVLMDVDGVLAVFTEPLLRELQEMNVAGLPHPDSIGVWDFIGEVLSEVQRKVAHTVLERHDFWMRLPVMPGAIEAIAAIRGAGHEVVFVTSPWTSCRGWADARRDWLKRHFDIGSRDLVVTARKDIVVGDTLVDDKEEHVRDWQTAHPHRRPWLFDAPYNRETHRWQRLSWSPMGVDRLLTSLAAPPPVG